MGFEYIRGKHRFLKERLFDYFVSKSGIMNETDIVLFTKPAFKRTVEFCGRKGIRTVAFASIMHPLFNYEMIKNEMTLLNLTDSSEYTNQTRVAYLSDFFSALDKILVQTDTVQRNYVQYGVDSNKIDVLDSSLSIDVNRFSPLTQYKQSKGDFIVLHVSNMSLIKGVHYLLSAWENSGINDGELHLAGKISPETEKVFRYHELDRVELLGYLDDPVSAYASADIFVSPSISDLNPFTVLEAMACGTPVIVSDQCGISSLVDHGKDGFIYRYNNVDELAGYLRWCYSNRQALKDMGYQARQKAELCSKHNIFADICHYLTEPEKE